MGPFALPVPDYRLGIHTRKLQQQRQRGDTAVEDEEDEDEERDRTATPPPPTPATLYSHLPADAINPRSHSPDTLRQLAVAGLAPEDDVPSASFPLFPHKPLPLSSSAARGGGRRRRSSRRIRASSGIGGGVEDSDVDVDADADGRHAVTTTTTTALKQHSARLKHLGTVTAIMHRCLAEGDVARAKRAFGLLLRTREVDVRANHLWAVGSEILMRDGETTAAAAADREGLKKQQHRHHSDGQLNDSGDGDGDGGAIGGGGEEEDEEHGVDRRQQPPPPPRRWGSAANVNAVRTYFENLIQQHPHDAHRPHLTSALDFWPVLFGIEIYNVDAEFRQTQHRLDIASAAAEEEEEEEARQQQNIEEEEDYALELEFQLEEGGSGGGVNGGGGGGDDDIEDRMEARRRRQRDEKRSRVRWAARDDLRRETRTAALRIAARMDEVMEVAPYTKHLELLRLRGMLALFVGDLHLPARLMERAAAGLSRRRRRRRRGQAGKDKKRSERGKTRRSKAMPMDDALLVRAAEGPDERSALARRREEQERARAFFERIVENRGVLDGWVKRFVDEDEDEDEEEEDDDDNDGSGGGDSSGGEDPSF